MSALTDDNAPSASLAAAIWRPAGLAYLAVMLLALAGGMWPEAIFPPRQGLLPAPRPVLSALAVGQTLFALLVYPLVLLRRSCVGLQLDGRSYWPGVLGESGFFLLASAPLFILGAFFADGRFADVIRAVLCGVSVWPLAWLAGAFFRRRRRGGRQAFLLALVVTALGLPAACYLVLEFFPPGYADAWADISPVLLAWRNGAAPADGLFPRPIWAWLLWPAVAGLGFLVGMMVTSVPDSAIPHMKSHRTMN